MAKTTTKAKHAGNDTFFLTGDPSLKGLIGVIDVCARVSSQHAVDVAAHQFAELARRAWLSRRLDALEEISKAIISLPADTKTQNIGHFYRALRLQTEGGVSRYRRAIQDVTDNLLPAYQPRAILALGASHYLAGEFGEFAYLSLEAARAAEAHQDYVTLYVALRDLAVVRSLQGDHIGALKDLERLRPVVLSIRSLYPSEYYEHLNSLAVELGELGRIEEANHAVDIALRSPFSLGYPHWQETKLELAAKQPKVFTPLVFALGALHYAQPAIQPTRENLQAAPMAAPEVKTSENPAAAQAQPARAPKAIRRISIFFSQMIKGRICDLSLAGALRLLKSPLALSLNRLGYSISPPSRAPPTTTC